MDFGSYHALSAPFAYYKLNGNALDSVGTAHGTWFGVEQYGVGHAGQAAKFVGDTQSYINLPVFATSPPLTVCSWIYIDSEILASFNYNYYAGSAVMTFDNNESAINGGSVSLRHVVVNRDNLHNIFRIESAIVEYTGQPYPNIPRAIIVETTDWNSFVSQYCDKWLFVATVYDGSTLIVYLNGENVGSASASYITFGEIRIGTQNRYKGALFDASRKSFFGLIDEVKIYKEILNEDQIKWIYRNG